ncbi:trigger factor [Desulfobacter hydrogenophilus]|uniref:Trigger factor n=1 Tax=Desulfobacter hydrogenophilus TaxID=2291 RepID=A0A328FC96_9BACT|nr:trigger factor [Desulfobacter hydrogenophilus]NDY73415.1 trigger factor [Desulfobacter hydrogenophilus]QBH12418.1 trigger factor [Desulfobacter hydrogenophilus]RAM00743.1 trigger factor [Desulfobacter hydrogenophilus]
MQVKIEDQSSIKKVLSFEIPKETISKELNKAYAELKKKADIKGFRKGKVPRKVLENRFSADVHAEVAPRLIQEAFVEAVETHKLDIVGGPQLDPPELNPDADYSFEITVEVKPELDEIDLQGLEIRKRLYEVTETEIESQIYMLQKTMATKRKVEEERPVKEDDFVLIDYEGFLNGETFEHTPKVENYVTAINKEPLPKEFSEKLIGAIPVQDLDIEVVYADDFHDENLSGKIIQYKVTLKEIQEEVLPEANDELVKGLDQYETLEDVKAAIRDNLEKGIEQRVKHEMSEQIFAQILEKTEFQVPQALIEGELNGIISETEQAYAQNNTSLDDVGLSREIMQEKYRDVAEKQARRHLILDKIITQEKMDLSDDELDVGFEEMAQAMSATKDAIKNFFNMDPRQLEYYKQTQLEKKAIELIIEKSTIVEVTPGDAQVAEEQTEEEGAQA